VCRAKVTSAFPLGVHEAANVAEGVGAVGARPPLGSGDGFTLVAYQLQEWGVVIFEW
jgi:hypothetical protein